MATPTVERQLSIRNAAWGIYCQVVSIMAGVIGHGTFPDEATSIQLAKDSVQAAKYFETACEESDFFDPYS